VIAVWKLSFTENSENVMLKEINNCTIHSTDKTNNTD